MHDQKITLNFGYYLPLIYFFNSLWFQFLPLTQKTCLITNLLFLPLVSFSFYKLTQKFPSSPKNAYLGFAILLFNPLNLVLFRSNILDFPLMASFGFFYFCLYDLEDFTPIKKIRFTFATLLGCLIKPIFLFFFLIACTTELLTKNSTQKLQKLRLFLFSLLPPLLLYSAFFSELLRTTTSISTKESTFSLGFHYALLYYPLSFISDALTFPVFLVFVISALSFSQKENSSFHKKIILQILLSFLFFMLVPVKDHRFLTPMLFPISFFISCYFPDQKKFIKFLLIPFFILQAVLLSFFADPSSLFSLRFLKNNLKILGFYVSLPVDLNLLPSDHKKFLDFLEHTKKSLLIPEDQTCAYLESSRYPLFQSLPWETRDWKCQFRPQSITQIEKESPDLLILSEEELSLLPNFYERIDTAKNLMAKNSSAVFLFRRKNS